MHSSWGFPGLWDSWAEALILISSLSHQPQRRAGGLSGILALEFTFPGMVPRRFRRSRALGPRAASHFVLCLESIDLGPFVPGVWMFQALAILHGAGSLPPTDQMGP